MVDFFRTLRILICKRGNIMHMFDFFSVRKLYVPPKTKEYKLQLNGKDNHYYKVRTRSQEVGEKMAKRGHWTLRTSCINSRTSNWSNIGSWLT